MRTRISSISLTVHRLPAGQRSLPGGGNSYDAFHRFAQSRCRRCEREADEIFARSAESGSRNGGNARIFQKNLANFFCTQAGGRNVDPGIERAFRRLATETGHAVKVAHKLLAPPGELCDYAGR